MGKLMGKIIFTDFDGTITSVDTCSAMAKVFSSDGWEEIDRLWQDKKISTEECANRTFQLFRAKPADLEEFLSTIKIDSYFLEFVKLAQIQDDKIVVLSDGYDFNINSIFHKYGINLPFYSNKLSYDGTFHIECVYTNHLCGNCGTCKTNLINSLKNDNDKVVYIGDGRSDFCPAEHADFVFAKNSLLKHCVETGIKATSYQDFGDIIREMNY